MTTPRRHHIPEGARFYLWEVLCPSPGNPKNNHAYWYVLCDCGYSTKVSGGSLRQGRSRSCKRCAVTLHGMHSTRTYNTWKGILQRCTDRMNKDWPNYGGRGITVCCRWLKFENFLEDMGIRPPGKEIDREDNEGPYERGNCRWATPRENSRHKRNSLWTIYQGERVCASEAAELSGIGYDTLRRRIKANDPDVFRDREE